MTKKQEKELKEFLYTNPTDDGLDEFIREHKLNHREVYLYNAELNAPIYCKGCLHILNRGFSYPCNVCSRGKEDKYKAKTAVSKMLDREKIIETLEHSRQLDFDMAKPTQDAIDYALAFLKEQTTKKGYWKKSKYADDEWHECSVCGTITRRVDDCGYKLICNYCRICGSDMREGGKDD